MRDGAATVGFPEMASLIRRMPDYASYGARSEAASEERVWRLALGRLLKDCGDQLLRVVELNAQIITDEQHDTIDALIERISGIFRRLNREGAVCLPAERRAAIAELEELDLRLLVLLEESLALTAALARDARSSSWFAREAVRLGRDLAALGDAAEERNLLLGLGWEAVPSGAEGDLS